MQQTYLSCRAEERRERGGSFSLFDCEGGGQGGAFFLFWFCFFLLVVVRRATLRAGKMKFYSAVCLRLQLAASSGGWREESSPWSRTSCRRNGKRKKSERREGGQGRFD